MKKVISLLVVLAMLLSCLPAVFAAQEEGSSACTHRHTRVETWQKENDQHYSVCYDCRTAWTEDCTYEIQTRLNPSESAPGSIVYVCAGSSAAGDVSHDAFTGMGCGRSYKVELPAGSYTYTNLQNGTHSRTNGTVAETHLAHRYTNGVCACGEAEQSYFTLQFHENSVANQVGFWKLNSVFAHIDTQNGLLFGTAYGTDPYLQMDAAGHVLGHTIQTGDIVEVRMKTNILSGSANQVQVFYTTTANPGYSEGRSVKLTDVSFAQGEYQVFRFALTSNVGETMNAIRLDPFSGIAGTFKADFEVDYIYVGAPDSAPSNYDENLRFDFEEDSAKYAANDAYRSNDFSRAFWNGSYAIENGALTLQDTLLRTEVAALRYVPTDAEYIQLRLCLEGCSANGKTPAVRVLYDHQTNGVNASAEDMVAALNPAETDYQIITLPVSSLFANADFIYSFGLRFENLEVGQIVIDSIYIGSKADLPETANTVTFLHEDGTLLASQTVNIGTAVTYPGETPTKPADEAYHYTFAGWVDASGNVADLSAVAGSLSVYASFTAEAHSYTATPIVTPTCTAEGSTLHTCACGRSYTEITEIAGHKLQAIPGKAATCTSSGLTEGEQCAVCGVVTVPQTTIPRLGHSYCYADNGATHVGTCERCGKTLAAAAHEYVDGTCVCGASEAPTVDEAIAIKHSLNLASDIAINYVIDSALLADYDSYYLECILPVYEGNALVGTETVILQPELRGANYYFVLSGLISTEINDLVDATLHMTKDGKAYVSNTDTYSIATYAYNQLGKSSNEKLKAMCANLLQYGAAAQLWKEYRTDALATANLSDAQKAYLSDLDSVAFGNNNRTLSDLANPTVSFVGKSLKLDSKVTIRYVINTTNYAGDLDDLRLRVRFVNLDGETEEVTLTECEVYNAAQNYYSFSFDGLLAAELRTVLSATVYEGNTQVSPTLEYSIDTYGNGKTGTLLAVIQAMIAYSDTALAYFG